MADETRAPVEGPGRGDTDLPLIFIHTRNSLYLAHTFRCARAFNPDQRIVLLGDDTNTSYTKLGIEHHHFADYGGQELERFNDVFKFVAGKNHGSEWWVRFVFQRWFHIHGFLEAEGIDRFWTFDSDTLILTDLSTQVAKYEGYDCTEQCSGQCMNGFVGSRSVVKGYVDTINDLFEDEAYLARQRAEFATHPDWAYTEMRAYMTYRERSRMRTLRLSTVIDGESFDDCICREPADMETTNGGTRKRLFFRQGGVYARHLPTGSLVRLNSANMSGAPTPLVEQIAGYAVDSKNAGWVTARVRSAAGGVKSLLASAHDRADAIRKRAKHGGALVLGGYALRRAVGAYISYHHVVHLARHGLRLT